MPIKELNSSIIDTIKDNYKKYGLMVNRERMFPDVRDGLKLVNRRILYTLFTLTKNGQLAKSARVVGDVLGKFHPHSDDSIYMSIAKLYHAGYLDRQGNFGIIGGLDGFTKNPPSAMRYTECKLSANSKKLIFSLIDMVPFEQLELHPEPLYLPTMLPLSFFSSELNTSIGFGVGATYPTYDKSDLIRRLLYLVGETKTEPVIKPTFPGKMEVLSSNKECKELLTTGKGKIILRPKIKYAKDKISILGRPVNKPFRSLMFRLFKDELAANQVALVDIVPGDRDTLVNVNIFSKKVNGNSIKYKRLLEKELQSKISFKCLFVDEDKVLRQHSVDDMLLRTYNQYKDLYFKKVEKDITMITIKIRDLSIIKKIRPFIADHLKGKPDYKVVIKSLAKKVNESEDVLKALFEKYSIKTLVTCSTDINPLLKQIKDLKSTKSEKHIISLYKALK